MSTFSEMTDRPIPVIGISCKKADSQSIVAMVAQVRAHGGIPRILTNHSLRDAAEDIKQIDGLFVMGNDFDVFPDRYIHRYPENDPRRVIHPTTNLHVEDRSDAGMEAARARADYQAEMLKLARDARMPTRLVCGGLQELYVMQGGGILQNVDDLDAIRNKHHLQINDNISPYCPTVPITIEPHSYLGEIAGKTRGLYKPGPPDSGHATIELMENTLHHQALDPDLIGQGLKIVAWSDEFINYKGEKRRLPEAIEPDRNGPLKDWPLIGTQWHPEFGSSPVSVTIIKTGVEAAMEYARHSTRDRSKDESAAMISNLYARPNVDKTYAAKVAETISAHSSYR